MKQFQTKTITILFIFIATILASILLYFNKDATGKNEKEVIHPDNYKKAFNIANDVIDNIFTINNPSRVELIKNGWHIQVFKTDKEMLDTTISQMVQQQYYLYDLVAHANPLQFYTMSLSSFIKKMNAKCTLDTNTVLYLNGCNTGVPQYRSNNDYRSAAAILADSIGCIVYGSRGYLEGTFAQQNEQCYTYNRVGTDAYPGSVSASGSDVWIRCKPTLTHRNKKKQTPKMNVGFKDTYNINTKSNKDSMLKKALFSSISGPPINHKIDSIQFCMFPDLVIIIDNDTFAIFNSYNYLIDKKNKNIFPLKRGADKTIIKLLEQID